jgi:GT2 family glycosyltransferase
MARRIPRQRRVSESLPADVAALLERRGRARAERDWASADALREQIRSLGWDPVDRPDGSTARPLLPAKPEPGVAYARAEDLASRLAEPASLAASVVVVLDDHPGDLERCLRGLAAHAPGGSWETVVVANAPAADPDPLVASALEDPAIQRALLRTSERLGWADAVNLGLRRARGAVIVLLDTSVEPIGDWFSPLIAGFQDDSVGIAGPWGVTSGDARQFDEAPPGEVDAIEGYCLAIRRAALQAVGGFDHRFRWYRNADLDLSFAVRDAGWRAIRTEPAGLARHEHRGWSALAEDERDRLSRRNFYRFLKHWGDRRDLLLRPGARRGHHDHDRHEE